VFGSDVSVQGCFFHLTQNTWRKVQELGLAETYRNDEDVKQFCGMVDALAFLPPDDVPAGVYTVDRECNNVFVRRRQQIIIDDQYFNAFEKSATAFVMNFND